MAKITVNKQHTLSGHHHSIYALIEGVNPRFFYTGAGDGYVVEWDMDNPKDGTLLATLPHSVYALTVDPVRNLLIVGHNFEGIHVIDLNSRKEAWSLQMTSQAIFDLRVHEDLLYVASGDGILTVIDLNAQAVKKRLKLSDASLRSLALHPSVNHLAVGSSDNSVKIIDINTLQPVANLTQHTNSVFALGYSPKGSWLVSGGRDAHMNIWNAETYILEKTIVAHMFAINYLSFRDDGRYFVTCSMDKSIKLWDAEHYRLLKVIDKGRHAGHGTSVNKVLWSTYNGLVVAVSDDRTISIWNIEV